MSGQHEDTMIMFSESCSTVSTSSPSLSCVQTQCSHCSGRARTIRRVMGPEEEADHDDEEVTRRLLIIISLIMTMVTTIL